MRRVIVIAAGLAALAFAPAPLNRRQARGAAKRIMSELRLPAGAVRAGSDPSSGLLGMPPSRPGTPDLVDLHAFWTLPGDPQGALQWIEQHPPAGSRQSMTGQSASPGHSFLTGFAGFSFWGLPGAAPSETLIVDVATARGGGSAVRADAQVTWLARRPRSERIPHGVRLVEVRVLRPGARSRLVSSPRVVGRIVTLVDRLPLAQPGAHSCPADRGPIVLLSFLRSTRASPLAIAQADGSGCGLVELSIRGRVQPMLADAPRLIRRVDALVR